MQADLFDISPSPQPLPPPLPDGLSFRDDVLEPMVETALIAAIDSLPLAPFRFQGWLGKRLTHSFGWSYDFDRGEVAAAPPMPDWLLGARRTAANFSSVPEQHLVQALLIRYDPGAGIGWHRDRPIFGHVVGLSLGAPATLRLRRRVGSGFQRCSLPLPPRSIYHLTGDARHLWEHSIAPMAAPRWSITFRSLSDKGRRMLE